MSQPTGLQEFIQRVEEFQIDPPDKVLSFVGRLARENNWSRRFAERVVLEYKRFCILAMQAGHPVTPSEKVDQAWHLHLTYTRSYWSEFCPNILGKPLHHDPTAGGAAEGSKFRNWYQATLDSYRRIFAAEPPADIWPTVQERFAHAGEWKWVNVGRSWVISKRSILASATVIGSTFVLLFVAGCMPTPIGMSFDHTFLSTLIPPFSFNAIEFLIFYLIVALVGLIAIRLLNNRLETEISAEPVDIDKIKLSMHQIAVLSGGGSRLIQCAVTGLYALGNLKVEKQTWGRPPKLQVIGERPEKPGVLQAVFDELGKQNPRLAAAIQSYYQQYVEQLQDLKLRHRSRVGSKAGMLVAGAVLLLGAIRVIQGLGTNHPVGFLVAQMTIFSMLALIFSLRFNMVTGAGRAVLQSYKQSLEANTAARPIPSGTVTPELIGAVALTGGLALTGIPELDLLKRSIDRNTTASSGADGGCGAGCGGGGGGGCGGGGCGGGGCGGCGG